MKRVVHFLFAVLYLIAADFSRIIGLAISGKYPKKKNNLLERFTVFFSRINMSG
jgi:hypothetical protein